MIYKIGDKFQHKYNDNLIIMVINMEKDPFGDLRYLVEDSSGKTRLLLYDNAIRFFYVPIKPKRKLIG